MSLEFCELPETILLQQWDKVGRRLVDSSLAIERNGETSCFSRFAITCSQAPGGGEVHLHCTQRADSTPSTQRSGAGNYLEMRLFYFAPLMDVLYSYFAKNIPGEFWIDHSDQPTSTSTTATTPSASSSSSSQRLSFLDDPSVRSRLGDAVQAMEERLRSLWQAVVDAPAGPKHERQAVHFLWLVEEWLHAQQMLAPAGDARLTLPSAASATERIKALFDLLHRLCPQ
ncbi:uncharacterized protein ACA1_347130 [Acanthamoeba castellanii str. Neff]|uniref:Uncharacterized protein n=1 Tax=Acanthamoeba castellanii (strain ATCC 30010 / Neff) TaxID=1257118 RepID=L8GTI4_ACACF|nr:uncharacterized protein ACA1_347130 [Acanthamoeba castellanii str. Neff]ELR16227.1 hypothetical protein ACA1_347130 [Acanthamoeba castellanii str. Neff]